MRIHRLTREQLVAAELDTVFAFFSLAHNLERITPPWLGFEVLTPNPGRRLDIYQSRRYAE